MRQRKVKNLDDKLEAVRKYMIEDPAPETWREAFPAQRLEAPRGLYLEIGCGKGDFLLQQALAHPERDFVGIEGQASVVLRAMEKAARIEAGAPDEDDPVWLQEIVEGAREDARSAANGIALDSGGIPLPNVRFACAFVNSLEEMFEDGSLSGIYLNFSDPWPKGRHAKRRLTYRGRLRDYAKVLKPGGFIAFKTDNDDLFDFTLEEIEACGWTPREVTRDLHGDGCDYEARQIMTEYERKFHDAGRQINYVMVTV